MAFHHGQGGGGSSANGRPRLGEKGVRLRQPISGPTLDPHISGLGRARREISTVLERGVKGLSNGISFVCVIVWDGKPKSY